MKNVLQVIDEVYQVIKVSQLKTEITGNLYKLIRPDNSTEEDVVINSLPISGDQIQLATINVNIYVPDKQVKISGKDQQIPDYVRLNTLTELATNTLQEHYAGESAFYISLQQVYREESIKYHYSNIRIEYSFFNN